MEVEKKPQNHSQKSLKTNKIIVQNKDITIHEECLDSNYASIAKLRQSTSQTANHGMQVVNGDDDDLASSSGDESIVVDPCPNMVDMAVGDQAQTVDADGWRVVSSRINRSGTH
ncbi:hypothetical protein LXL04_012452 [Taraxacum kok-saghyz]